MENAADDLYTCLETNYECGELLSPYLVLAAEDMAAEAKKAGNAALYEILNDGARDLKRARRFADVADELRDGTKPIEERIARMIAKAAEIDDTKQEAEYAEKRAKTTEWKAQDDAAAAAAASAAKSA